MKVVADLEFQLGKMGNVVYIFILILSAAHETANFSSQTLIYQQIRQLLSPIYCCCSSCNLGPTSRGSRAATAKQ